MIQLEQTDDISPLCPHCEKPLGKVLMQELKGFLGRRYVYFCASCRKTLGISHRKGLWMG